MSTTIKTVTTKNVQSNESDRFIVEKSSKNSYASHCLSLMSETNGTHFEPKRQHPCPSIFLPQLF